jgi:UDP-N-acetylglucosamine 4,6-dehydratase/5-epimerase
MLKICKDKCILITGGTGSFGSVVLERLVETDVAEIRIFSRDEKKQDDLRKSVNRKYKNCEKVKFYIGDVRDYSSLLSASVGVDYIFHAAALKQVPSCEFYPTEAVKTNILGTENVINAAIRNEIKKVVCLSTDKAVYPINAMGISKAMMEKILIAKTKNLASSETIGCCTRYGNVMASRNSVIPLFVSQILSDQPLTVTDPNMTRFMMSLKDSVDLVLFALSKGRNGEILVQKAPAVTIEVLVKAISEIFEKPHHPTKIIGTRHGEKLFETLLSREEMINAVEVDNYFRVIPDLRDLNYTKYVEEGLKTITGQEDYTSHNTERLDVNSTVEMLLTLPFIQMSLKGEIPQTID